MEDITPPTEGTSVTESSSSRNTKKKRGPSKSVKTMAIPHGQPVKLRANHLNQLIGDEAAQFSTYLGTLIRSQKMMPLNYEDWRYVPEHYKEQLWNHIQYKYEIPIQCQKHVRQQISGIWRAFKKELKKQTIKKYGCLENSQPDDRVPADQWRDLVAIWTFAKKKAISEKNKDNRKLQVLNHSSGRMSYARVGEKLSKEHPTGKWPGRVKVFLITHKKRGTNQPTDERSRIVMAKIKQKQSELPPELRDNSDEEDNIYREACGEEGHGRVRGIGLGHNWLKGKGSGKKR
ncbi:uncharacterized protein LOC122070620 [Macadamia integrifolia]|uniref:uncharacterized protein LOC122070620 n=1 Tax=Macadamia integrifolia TaxID=60698 RepID=UPI001C4EB2CF|nr:uncharacterized protein LOC122070620 [Macadamia integrifolia]